jgi:hypothetical protein
MSFRTKGLQHHKKSSNWHKRTMTFFQFTFWHHEASPCSTIFSETHAICKTRNCDNRDRYLRTRGFTAWHSLSRDSETCYVTNVDHVWSAAAGCCRRLIFRFVLLSHSFEDSKRQEACWRQPTPVSTCAPGHSWRQLRGPVRFASRQKRASGQFPDKVKARRGSSRAVRSERSRPTRADAVDGQQRKRVFVVVVVVSKVLFRLFCFRSESCSTTSRLPNHHDTFL